MVDNLSRSLSGFDLLTLALAIFYCSYMLIHQQGPGGILSRFQGWLVKRTPLASCPHCLGFWLGLGILAIWLMGLHLPILFLAVMGLHTLLHTVYDRLVTY